MNNPAPPPEDDSSFDESLLGIHHGDALELLRRLPDQSIDSVVTDPPYALNRRGQMLGQVSANYSRRETHSRGYADNDPGVFFATCIAWTSECLRVLKPGGHLVAFGGTRNIHHLARAVEDVGMDVRGQVVWAHKGGKPHGTHVVDTEGHKTGWHSTLRPMHEPAVLARKSPIGTLKSNFRHFGTGALNIEAGRFGGQARWPVDTFVDGDVSEALGSHGSVYFGAKPGKKERPVVDGTSHDTVKPLWLMRELVRLTTPLGGITLDPFAGSGTTAEAALLEGMRFIAVESEAKYIPLIEARVERAGVW